MSKNIKRNLVFAAAFAALIVICVIAYINTESHPPIIPDTNKPSATVPNIQAGLPISDKDFAITNGKEIIQLDSPFKSLKTAESDTTPNDNYDGDVSWDGVTYKFYVHKYPDFNLQTSNTNYNLKKRNQDEEYITQILPKSQAYATMRGIGLASTISDVVKAYGEGKTTSRNDLPAIVYQYKDMEMTFIKDPDNPDSIYQMYMKVLIGAASGK